MHATLLQRVLWLEDISKSSVVYPDTADVHTYLCELCKNLAELHAGIVLCNYKGIAGVDETDIHPAATLRKMAHQHRVARVALPLVEKHDLLSARGWIQPRALHHSLLLLFLVPCFLSNCVLPLIFGQPGLEIGRLALADLVRISHVAFAKKQLKTF